MTDSEIIGYLKEISINCDNSYARYTLDLIIRQKERIEELTKIAEYQQSLAMEKHFEVKSLKEKRSQLKAELEKLNLDYEKLQIKYENIEKELKYQKIIYKTAKVEACKEFADKLKKEIEGIRRNAQNRHITAIVEILLCLQQKINKLLKETAGEDNATE